MWCRQDAASVGLRICMADLYIVGLEAGRFPCGYYQYVRSTSGCVKVCGAVCLYGNAKLYSLHWLLFLCWGWCFSSAFG